MPVLRKQLVAVVDRRTTPTCLYANGQIVDEGKPFQTLSGAYDYPPFHAHCRTRVVPFMSGFANTARAEAKAELRRRKLPVSEDRYDGYIMPGPEIEILEARVFPKRDLDWAHREFFGDTEITRELERYGHGARTGSPYPDDVAGALRQYGRISYESLNARLRGTLDRLGYQLSAKDEAFLDDLLQRLDQDFAHQLTDDVMVLRGMTNATLDSLQEGAIITDRAFTSTTLLDDVADQFLGGAGVLKGDTSGAGVIAQIQLKKGQRVAFMGDEEAELLLPRGTSFRVVQVQPGDPTRVLLEVVE